LKEELMKAMLAGVGLGILLGTPAFADFYIVQDPTTKRCRIVEQRPGPGLGIIIGDRGFGVRVDAESHMRTVVVCREGTQGRGGGGGDREVIIEERR
jgi:hypothetical protein